MINPAQVRFERLIQEKRDEIIAIADKHGAYNLRIFGSIARGEATEKSDIDLLIDRDLTRTSPWFPAGLKLDLEDLLGVSVDVGTVNSLKTRIRERVLSEAKPL